MLPARESLFLRGSHNAPIDDQGGGRIVKDSVNTENVQRCSAL
jgi:hypothetical protein